MKKLKGIRRKGKKWEAYVRVAGTLRTKTFDEFDVPTVRAWQEQQRSTVAPPPEKGTLAAYAEEYFAKPEIAAQPSVGQKKAHVNLWLDLLGWDTPIDAITRDRLEHILQDWLKTLAPATVYHRRSSLLAVFTFVYGTHAENVVLDTTVPTAWTPRDQSVDFPTLARILEAMPTERRPSKGIRLPSAARLVSELLMHTGVRGCDLVQVRRPHVNWQRGTVQMPPTKKGQGGEWWTCVLTPEGLSALRAFDAADLYGKFSPAAVSHSYKRACRRVLGPETAVHLYSMRHSVGAEVLRASGDTSTVGRVLGHAPGSRMAEQYSKGAHAEVDRRAIEAMAAARRESVAVKRRSNDGETSVERRTNSCYVAAPAAEKLAEKLATSRKRPSRRTLRRVS
jgi:integrase